MNHASLTVVGLGCGGHARVVIDAIHAVGGMAVAGLLDVSAERVGTFVDGVPILGTDELLPDLRNRGVTHVFVGIGGTGDLSRRRDAFDRAEAAGLDLVTIVHPAAVVSGSAVLGRGVVVLANAVVNAGAVLEDNVLVNTGAIVEHDCRIGRHSHVATGARLSGSVEVGESAHLGIGCSVRQSIHIGHGAVVGAGAVVIQDVPERTVVVGVPARVLRAAGQGAEQRK